MSECYQVRLSGGVVFARARRSRVACGCDVFDRGWLQRVRPVMASQSGLYSKDQSQESVLNRVAGRLSQRAMVFQDLLDRTHRRTLVMTRSQKINRNAR